MQQSLEMEGASRTSELQMPVRRSRRQRSSAVEPRATTQHPRSSLAALPATAAASADRAETAASLHKWAEALAMYERAIALHGGAEARPEECASWLDGVADCLVALARWGYALAAADIVIGIDELYFNGWFCRAQALAHWGEEEGGVRWQESVASFEECLRCDMPAIDERAVRKELQWTMDAMRTTVERAAARAHELCDPGRVDGEGEAVEPDYTAAREAYSEALDSCVSGHELEGSLRDARASCHLHFRFWPCAELAERDALRAVELQPEIEEFAATLARAQAMLGEQAAKKIGGRIKRKMEKVLAATRARLVEQAKERERQRARQAERERLAEIEREMLERRAALARAARMGPQLREYKGAAAERISHPTKNLSVEERRELGREAYGHQAEDE